MRESDHKNNKGGWEKGAYDNINGGGSEDGKYYLVDAGFSLVPGFLSPYRRTRYHRRDIKEDLCEEDFGTSDDEVNPTHADVPEEATINAHISFTADASWSSNRDAMAQSMWVNHNPNADAEIEFD
ncbi:Uncharacterized protein Adt_06001 [Abeliophyllum distichum]|uniref:DDE Tnp4 domain-containing protein n=1 Tax=Abeliophyllum distichum TaxID=126358 RepID=A0ABD1V5N5_9LAMI